MHNIQWWAQQIVSYSILSLSADWPNTAQIPWQDFQSINPKPTASFGWHQTWRQFSMSLILLCPCSVELDKNCWALEPSSQEICFLQTNHWRDLFWTIYNSRAWDQSQWLWSYSNQKGSLGGCSTLDLGRQRHQLYKQSWYQVFASRTCQNHTLRVLP